MHSGLAMADPFETSVPNRQLLDHYVFNGSAAPGVGWVTATAQGLDVGVRSHAGWAGWFAVTLPAAGPDVVWHAVMSRPSAPVNTGVGEAVLAVQSASTQRNGTINYVVVSALSSGGKGTWQVGSAHGYLADAVTDRLWQEPLRADTPATEPVTIRTDGQRSLTVWFGDRVVYSSDHLHMNDPAPFQAYLEVQGRDIGYVSNFKNFWVADAAPVIVRGVQPRARVELDTGHGVVTAEADSAGRAALPIPAPELVGTGTLTVARSFQCSPLSRTCTTQGATCCKWRPAEGSHDSYAEPIHADSVFPRPGRETSGGRPGPCTPSGGSGPWRGPTRCAGDSTSGRARRSSCQPR